MVKYFSIILFALVLGLGLVSMPSLGHAVSDSKASPNEAVYQPDTNELIENSVAPQAGEAQDPHAEKKEGGLPQLNIATYPSQIFWLLVMFSVLYVAFSKSILPSIGSVVEARDLMIKGNIDEAEVLKNKAQNIQSEYEKSLDKAKADAAKAVHDVELAAKKKLADQIDAFRKRAEGDVAVAENNVLAAKTKAMGDMTSVVTEVASLAAEKITGTSTDRQNAQNIVESIAGKAKAA